MTVKAFLIGSLFTTIVSWAILVAIIRWLDPHQAGWLGYLLFFLALFLAVASTSGIIGYTIRRIITPGQLSSYAVRTALRQGLLLGLFLVVLLFLQLMELYQWWMAVIVIVLFLSIEIVFLSLDGTRANKQKT